MSPFVVLLGFAVLACQNPPPSRTDAPARDAQPTPPPDTQRTPAADTQRAQAPAPATKDSAPAAKVETPAKPVQEQSANEWRASKVIGLYVYNDANERLGSINEVLMDSSGKIN